MLQICTQLYGHSRIVYIRWESRHPCCGVNLLSQLFASAPSALIKHIGSYSGRTKCYWTL